jgi:[protein-PII] uridylyltransferase
VSALPSAAAPLADRLARADGDAAWRDTARAALAENRDQLRERFAANEAVERLIDAHCTLADTLVLSAWSRCVPEGAPLGLVATGGYGRRELYPHSDIDLLVLAEPAAQKTHAAALSHFFALLWDAGLAAGHATRSIAECQQAARDDITVLTALSEPRVLAGPVDLPALADTLSASRIWPADVYYAAKRAEQRTRHARFNDTADNLEPNLKEGPGGLRDLHTVTWMGMRLYGVGGLRALVPLGVLGEDECASLEREWKVLARLRFGLHLVSKRKEERLLFDHQKTLAALMGLEDAGPDNLAVEQMMQAFFRAAATVLRISDRLLQRFEEQLAGEAAPVPVEPGFVLRHGYLASEHPERLATGMAGMLPLFAAWGAISGTARGLHSETARALAEALPHVKPYAEETPEVRHAFLALLAGPHGVASLRRMARVGVLARYLPAFGKVAGRMQYDLFHVYTVDQHTLAVLRLLEGFLHGPVPGFAMTHEVVPRLRKPFLLLLAGLFHDIAKGRGGDHSVLGADEVRAFSEAHGLPSADVELLAWLVREHLLMSVTAQRQDISDPAVITRFAERIADREHLEYLYLLTCADIAGTSPKLWNAWKDRLLADLYTATRLALRRGLEHPVAGAERAAETREAAQAMLAAFGARDEEIAALFARMPEIAFQRGRPDQIAWQAASLRGVALGDTRVRARPVSAHGGAHAGALEVFVHSPDRDGLFAAIVATLDRLGLAIQQARVLDGPLGAIFDTFEVVPTDPRQPASAEEVERRLEAALSGSLERIKPARRAQPRHLRHFRIAPQIEFAAYSKPDALSPRSVLSLVCTDRPGLLADVAQTLRKQRLRVHDARIATFGERAEDVFQITSVNSDGHDSPLDQTQQQALRDALLACLEGDSR